MTREEKERIQQKLHRAADAHLNAYGGNLYYEGVARGLEQAAGIVGKTKCVDAVEVTRCKDCVHKPYVVDVFHASYGDVPVLESNGKCPCINADDYFYSHMPDDDWFCADAERREADGTEKTNRPNL